MPGDAHQDVFGGTVRSAKPEAFRDAVQEKQGFRTSVGEPMARPRPAATPSPAAPSDRQRLDPDSFAALFAQHYQRLWLLAAGITGDRNQADDLVQDAGLTALEKLGQFEPGTNFFGWMARIVRLKALNAARTTAKRKTKSTDPLALDRGHASSAGGAPASGDLRSGGAKGVDLRAFETDFDDDLLEALAGINDVARSCLLLRVVMDLSYTEISVAMEIPEGTAMSHVHRAKRALRRRLEPKYLPQSSARETSP